MTACIIKFDKTLRPTEALDLTGDFNAALRIIETIMST